MGIHTSRKKEYYLKSRIDLLEKINTKPYFMMTDIPTVKLNYIMDAQNNRKQDTVISKTFENPTKTPKMWGNM